MCKPSEISTNSRFLKRKMFDNNKYNQKLPEVKTKGIADKY